MKSRVLGIFVFVVFGMMVGCSKVQQASLPPWQPRMTNPPVREITMGEQMGVPDMQRKDVIVAVNGITFTREDMDLILWQTKWVIDHDRMMRPQQSKSYYNHVGLTAIPNFVRRQVFAWEGRKQAAATVTQVVDYVEARVKKSCQTQMLTREQFDRQIPGGIRAVQFAAEDAFWASNYLACAGIKGKPITDEIVAAVQKSIADENAGAIASNNVRRAFLTRLRGEILTDKISFGAAADKYSEDIHYAKDGTGCWGEFRRQDLPEAEPLFDMNEGDISEVYEDDEGLSLVRVEEKIPAKRDASGKVVEPSSVRFGRIFLEKDEVVQLAAPKSLKEDLQSEEDKSAIDAEFERLCKLHKIVYPHGTNFWQSVPAKGVSKGEKK